VRLFTRNGNDWTDRYPWIVEDVARLPVKRAIIDAEYCCADSNGVTDFNTLHSRLNDNEVFAFAFDLLLVDDVDLRPAQLSERKARVAKLLRKAKPGIRLSEHIEADGVRSTPADWAWKASSRSASTRLIVPAESSRGSK
jgi:ATP-dependent DNA ligase